MANARPSEAATGASGEADGETGFDTRDFRHALGCFATGVTVVTARSAEGWPIGMTVSSFNSVSLEPPLVVWSLSVYSPSMPIFQEASHYAVNVLASDQVALALHFARSTRDKFAGLDYGEGLGGAALLKDVCAHFECLNEYRYYGGDHVVLIGRVVRYTYTPREPLLFCHGRFQQVAPLER